MHISHQGRRLNVIVEGAEGGPPVVFVHGLSSSAETFAWLPPEVAAGRRIVRLDLRGHGGSDPAPGTYVLDAYGSDVVAVLREVAVGPAVLVGHSLGACVAWWVAQSHPELLTGALLEDPPLYMAEPAEHEANPHLAHFDLTRDAARAWQAEGVAPEAIAAEIASEPVDPEGAPPGRGGATMADLVEPDAIATMARALLAMDPEVMTAAKSRETLAGTDLASPIAVPMLLLAAEVVPGFTEAHERRLAASHPEVEVVRVAGAGHMIHDEIEHRPAFVSALAAFLDRCAPLDADRRPRP